MFATSKYNKVLDYFEYDEENDSYNLDKLEEVAEEIGITTWKVGNITGKGNLEFLKDENSIKAKEIYTMLFLTEAYYIITEKLDASYWVYYTSLNEFISIRKPDDNYVSSDEFKYDSELLEMQFVKEGTYDNHPKRTDVFWTHPYIDLGGAGLMVTASFPVDYKEQYVGSLSVDFIAKNLSDLLRDIYPTYLVDNEGQVIATNVKEINTKDYIHLFDELKLGVDYNKIKKIRFDETEYVNFNKVIASAVEGTPYVLYQVYPLSQSIIDLLIYMSPIMIALFMLLGVNIVHALNQKIRMNELKQQEELRMLEKEQEELDYIASYDMLTNLYNRRGLNVQIDKIKQDGPNNLSCLLIFDIDYFKKVNDTYGHDIGDSVLSEIASLIKGAIRDNDIVARYGGEEFIIILNKCPLEKGLVIADEIRKLVENHEFTKVKKVTISIGLSVCKNIKIQEYGFKNSDEALYKAKQTGRNRVCYIENGEIKTYLDNN